MCLFIEATVLSGFNIACLFANCPTNLSPVFENPTIEGVVLEPSEFAITVGFPPSITATTEFVVPKSIPIVFAIFYLLFYILLLNILHYYLITFLYNNLKNKQKINISYFCNKLFIIIANYIFPSFITSLPIKGVLYVSKFFSIAKFLWSQISPLSKRNEGTV